jgi:lipopolysaccharide export system permease protein
MRILPRYILREHFGPFLLGLCVLTFVLLMDQVFTLMDMLIGKGLPLGAVGEVFLLSLPFILAVTTPMAVLVAALMAFGRMAQDNEVTALRSSGLPFHRLLIAPFLASWVVCAFLLFFNNYILPEANHRVRNLLLDIAIKKPALKLKEGAFITDFEDQGYILFIKKVDIKTSRIFDVTIFDLRKGGSPFQPSIPRNPQGLPSIEAPQTIISKMGELCFSPDGRTLTVTLRSGTIHSTDPKESSYYRKLPFEKMTINLPVDLNLERQSREFRSEREMGAPMMLVALNKLKKEIAELRKARGQTKEPIPEIQFREQQIDSYWVEIHKKFAIAFACPIFILLGAPLGVKARRGGVGIGFGVSLAFFVVYYLFLVGGEEFADRGFLSPFLAMWAANILLGVVGVFLTLQTTREFHFWRKTVIRNLKSKTQN